ncbi:MAG: hypothetical protein WHV66_10490 [Anaerolineales bacterium]
MTIFDRFIRYEWAEYALETTLQNQSSKKLKTWLEDQGLGSESARRTSNVLCNLWFESEDQSVSLRQKALNLCSSIEENERVVLHWGMALVRFPLFCQTAGVIGRIVRLQGEFKKAEIIYRVLEKYSNQTTVKRAVERVIQTMLDWEVVHIKGNNTFFPSLPRRIQSPQLAEWFFQALLLANPEKYWLVEDILRSNEGFPFELSSQRQVLYTSYTLSIQRDSFGEEIVGLRAEVL